MNKTKKVTRLLSGLIILINLLMLNAGCISPTPGKSGAKPNVIIIFTDDQGYGDLGCFGSTKIKTPHIDRMAKEGCRFTSFMVGSSVCSPSRAALLTGCYPKRVGLHKGVLFPNSTIGRNPSEYTIADHMKGQGYATACVGKWHLGDQPQFLPHKKGFDEYFGIPYSNDMGVKQRRPQQNPPLPLMRNDKVIEAPVDQTTVTKRYAEEAVRSSYAGAD